MSRHDEGMTLERESMALCSALAAEAGAPEWMHILPLGPDIKGRDGREWTITDPAAFCAASAGDMPVDWDHGSEIPGRSSAAAGWVKELRAVNAASSEFPEPGIWARVEWTPKGRESVASKEFRHKSPAFSFAKNDGKNEIRRLLSVGLTNAPNLDLVALNRAGEAPPETEKPRMSELHKAVCARLELASDASESAVIVALNARFEAQGKALADATERANKAETALNARDAADFERERTQVLDDAVKAGKVAPASRDHFAALCSSRDGLTQVKALLSTIPSITAPAPAGKTDVGAAVELTPEERAMCRAAGITEAEFLATKSAAEARGVKED